MGKTMDIGAQVRRFAPHWGAVMLGYLLLAAVALGANPFRGQTAGPFDLLVSQYGFGNQVDFAAVRHPERSDVLDALLPHWLGARDELRRGRIPLWNAYTAGGEAGIFNPNNVELSPGFAVFALVPSPAIGFYLAILLNLTLLGTGAYVFLRRRLMFFPALFGGVVAMLCGFSTAWLYWPHVATLMWVCWLLAGIGFTVDKPGFAGALRIAVSLALMLVGGFPFVALLGFGSACLLALCEIACVEPRLKRRVCVFLGLGLVGGFGLAAPGLIGFWTWYSQLDMSWRNGLGGSWFLGSLYNLKRLLPHFARANVGVEQTIYVGLLAALLALTFFGVAVTRIVTRRRLDALQWFVLGLAAVSFVLVFQLIEPKYLSWVPGLRNNVWTRASCMLDLSLAFAAALALDAMGRLLNPRVCVAVAIPMLVGQLYDSISFFRLFNGPVPAAYFYPRNPLLDEVAEKSLPFQTAIADDNYLVSGSLGAYGIGEWFGHAFKPSPVRNLLGQIAKNPFTSMTASRMGAESFDLASPYMNVLGVRYALGDIGLLTVPIGPNGDTSNQAPIALPPLPQNRWRQTIDLAQPRTIGGIQAMLATYGRSDLKGALHVALYSDATPPKQLASWNQPAAEIDDNDTRFFPLDKPIVLAAGRYAIEFTYDSPSAKDQLTVWSLPGAWKNCALEVDGKRMPACMNFALDELRTDYGGFVAVGRWGKMYLMENKSVPSGAYFVAKLDGLPMPGPSRGVTTQMSSQGFQIRYNNNVPGYVVVPMNFIRGWHASIDGKPVYPARYFDALPAVAVKGPVTIRFIYRPLALWGLPISLATLMLMAGAAFAERRKHAIVTAR